MSLPGGNIYLSTDNAATMARQNIKGLHQMTGDELIAFLATADSKKGMIISVILDSTDGPPASKKKGVAYMVDPSNVTQAIPLNDTIGHKHTGASDGGSFLDVAVEGLKNTWFCKPLSMVKEVFYQTSSGATFTNSLVSNDQFLEINTGTTINNYGNIHATNGWYSFGFPMRMNIEIKLTDVLTSYTARAGLGAEQANQTTDDLGKILLEACPTCNGNNIRIVSATGVTNSRSNNPKNSTNAANTRDKFLLQLFPGANVTYVSSTGILTKTLDVPSLTSGNVLPYRAFVAGIQTSVGAAAKKMAIYQLEAVAQRASTSYVTY